MVVERWWDLAEGDCRFRGPAGIDLFGFQDFEFQGLFFMRESADRMSILFDE